jgi:hypothetical protein
VGFLTPYSTIFTVKFIHASETKHKHFIMKNGKMKNVLYIQQFQKQLAANKTEAQRRIYAKRFGKKRRVR